MGILYVAGQRPGAGATAVAVGLATLWQRAGNRVAVVKPASLRADDPDAAFYARSFDAPETDVVVIEGDDGMKAAADVVAPLADAADVVIVEGLPLFCEDGSPCERSAAFAESLGARVLGVVPYNRTLDSSDAAAWRDSYAGSMAGVVFNRRGVYGVHDAASRLAPAFEDAGVSVYGVVPEERLLLAPTVQQVADLLGGTYYAGVSGSQALVEHFLMGGLITEWGGNYFGRLENQAVLVRGGRTDIQMSALNFPLNGLFLTGCQQPPQYVYQRAADLDVPLVVTDHDTPTATSLLEQIDGNVTVDHPAKFDRLVEMMHESLDMESVSAAAGLHFA